MKCVFGGLYPGYGLARHSQGICPGVSRPWGFGPFLFPRTFWNGLLWPWTVLLISSDRIGLERRTSHTSATNSNKAGPTSVVATAVPDSVVQRKKLHLSPDEEAFSGNTDCLASYVVHNM